MLVAASVSFLINRLITFNPVRFIIHIVPVISFKFGIVVHSFAPACRFHRVALFCRPVSHHTTHHRTSIPTLPILFKIKKSEACLPFYTILRQKNKKLKDKSPPLHLPRSSSTRHSTTFPWIALEGL